MEKMERYESDSRHGIYNSGPREMTDVTCSDCGKQTQVPFKPDGSRPVYCSECLQMHRPVRRNARYINPDLDENRKRGSSEEESSDNAALRLQVEKLFNDLDEEPDMQFIPLRRLIPVRVYLPEENPDEIASINTALGIIFKMLDVDVFKDAPAEIGSWFKRFIVKTKQAGTQPEVLERLQKIERALELQALHQPQSVIDKNEAEAASLILSALGNVSSAVIQIGSLIIIKLPDSASDPHILIRNLSTQELIFLENNQDLLKSPQELLSNLTQYNRGKTRKQLLSTSDKIDAETSSLAAENKCNYRFRSVGATDSQKDSG